MKPTHSKEISTGVLVLFFGGLKLDKLLFWGVDQNEGYFGGLKK